MTIEHFIERAIEGGYDAPALKMRLDEHENKGESMESLRLTRYAISVLVLDPLAWQAVGKVEGWGNAELFMDDYTNNHPFMGGTIDYPYQEGAGMTYEAPGWIYRMHRMVDALAEGKTIEEYLSTL